MNEATRVELEVYRKCNKDEDAFDILQEWI